jgi:putative heme-binding domain-containing protein
MRLVKCSLLLLCLLTVHAGQPSSLRADQAERPFWIWADGPRNSPQQVELRRSLQVNGPIQQAELRLAAEFSNCELRIGEQTVLTVDDYGPWIDVDVTEHLRSGEIELLLRCSGSEGPSAILVELTVRTIGGDGVLVQSDANWQGRLLGAGKTSWQAVKSYGMVARPYWDADRVARITPFDDYEQWRQASSGSDGVSPTTFFTRPGFEIDRIREATKQEGSWVSMEFDSRGRLVIAREDQGLLRMSLSEDGRAVTAVQSIDDSLQECRGLAFIDGALYVQANNSKALYRLEDRDGDDQFEFREQLREFPGGVGHGRNDLAVGPDQGLYAIFGDAVDLPSEAVIDHTSPYREARRGERTTEGHLLCYFPDSQQWHLLCSGLRNPFGIDFNGDGEAFTYDADAEFDMGAPWYRPTRLVQLVAGGDYGWRGRTKSWPPYDADHVDFTLPSGDIGKGSPTAVKSGLRSSFPDHYQRAMFALDWAYGRILACHLVPRGAGYLCRAETFLKGRPLNVTDLDFAADGSLYVITGGRKTHSNLYRVRWTGGDAEAQASTPQQIERREFSKSQREVRSNIASMVNRQTDRESITEIWESLGQADPMLRDAARVALEHQPLEVWCERAFEEPRASWVITCMLSLARSDREDLIPRILQKLLEIRVETLSGYERSMLLETWAHCLSKDAASQAAAYQATVERITDWYPDLSAPIFAPTGAGRSVNHQLALLAERVDVPELVAKTVSWLARAESQEERIHAIFVLRNCRRGWTDASRRIVFETLGELDRTVLGGEGMPGFLRQIREELVATLTASERTSLGALIKPGGEVVASVLRVDRPIVRQWEASDMERLLHADSGRSDRERGRTIFREALCIHCHRVEGAGGVAGPDLSSVAARFSREDLLRSILDPSSVVAEKYQNEQIVTIDGRVLVGRIMTGGDYRSTKLRIATDPLRPSQLIEIEKSEIESHRPSTQSPMPAGLLDRFTAEEIQDLVAYLEQATP